MAVVAQSITFEHIRSAHIPSLNVEIQEYRHPRTGAMHYHLAADDSNNAFMVAFKTVPSDSTGVAHILEHTTLCGSERFPVRDPFFMMLRRSLNTFMNAFTSSDTTAYPFATRNYKDFDNLLQVYLDSVFFPRLDELDFAQEGHRVELADPENPDSSLVYKGVVYNEMKGAMSSPTLQLWQAVQSAVYPTTTYHFNSGGEPLDIPKLTHAQLTGFHARHYHPSNATFLTYGDFPVEEHQRKFEEYALRHFSAQPMDVDIPPEQRFDTPQSLQVEYPIENESDGAGKSYHALAWLLDPVTDQSAMMTARLIETVLLNNSAAPLRHALETTDLGAAPGELCGLDDSLREVMFMASLEGSEPEHAEAFEELLLDTLQRLADEGIPKERVASALHQLELSQREVESRQPYGLQLMGRILPAAIHGGDPVADLNLDPVLEQLREESLQPGWFQDAVRRLFLDNPHRVRVSMVPDPTLASRRDDVERDRLQAMREQMDREEVAAVVSRAEALISRQSQEDDPGILPKVTLADVPGEISAASVAAHPGDGVDVYAGAAGTNGLVHQYVVTEIPDLAPEEIRTLAMLADVLTEVGAGDSDYLGMQQRQADVGSVSAYVTARSAVDNPASITGRMVLEGTTLARSADALTELLRDSLAKARFDEADRLRDLVAQFRADAESGVTMRGHSLASLAAARRLAPVSEIAHQWDGLATVATLQRHDREFEADPTSATEFGRQLAELHAKLLQAPRKYLLVAEAERLDAGIAGLRSAWAGSASGNAVPMATEFKAAPGNEAWVVNTQVNFCGRAFAAVPAAHADASALSVLAHLLRDGFLHRAIREQGGAYGGGAAFDTDSATFRMYSYRDPRLAETLADFDAAIDWIGSAKIEFAQLEEAILGVIKDLDQPASPAGEVSRRFFNDLAGRTLSFRREYRERVLAVQIDDVRRVAGHYLANGTVATAVLTDSNRAEALADEGFEVSRLV